MHRRFAPSSFVPGAFLFAIAQATLLFGAGLANAEGGDEVVLSESDEQKGRVRFIVFVQDRPAPNIRITLGGDQIETGDEGSAVFEVLPGDYNPVFNFGASELLHNQSNPEVVSTSLVEVVADAEVEVLVTFTQTGEIALFDVEQARDTEPTAPQPADADLKVTLQGKIQTSQGKPIEGAQILVRGQMAEATSDANGDYLLQVPAASLTLVIIASGYKSKKVDELDLTGTPKVAKNFTLETAVASLDDFVVTAPFIEGGIASLVAEQRDSSSMSDVIGAEQMSRSGDSSAASALKRVTGITLVGGGFIFVRGMGERYSSTLLNGQYIPSPEPERRVVPLSLFSTDVLESVVVQKSTSPDSPGEFGGGVVKLRTKSVPEGLVASFELKTGIQTNATFKDRPSYQGGATDFLGFDDGTRSLPDVIRQQSPLRLGNRFQDGLSSEDLANLGREMKVNYDVADQSVRPNLGMDMSLGKRWTPFDIPVGVLFSNYYSDSYSYFESPNVRYSASDATEDGLQLNNDFFIRNATRNVTTNSMLTAGIEPSENHSLKFTSMLLRIANNDTAFVTGRSNDLGADIERYRLRFVDQSLWTNQLQGHHQVSALAQAALDWRYAFSKATRLEPDRREYYYIDRSADPNDGNPDFQISARPDGNQRVWSDMNDTIHDLGGDLTLPFNVPWSPRGDDEKNASLKMGSALMFRRRQFETLRFTMTPQGELSDELRRMGPEQIWAKDNFDAETGWILQDTTQPTDSYSAKQNIQAAYAMSEFPIHPSISVMLGARLERSNQQVVTFDPFAPEAVPLTAVIDNTDLLPSGTFKWELRDSYFLRGGYGRSVTRPDFRELSQSQYLDVVTATRYVGNSELQRGTIDNFDARLEHYFSESESASIGAFYKSFDSPIEQVDRGGVDRSITWDNAEGATNYGVEIEGQGSLAFLHPRFSPAFASVNMALIRSEVRLGDVGTSTSKERALQGQSPYIINMQLGWDDDEGSGIRSTLAYNVNGRRIEDVGRLGTPDTYEQPFHQLDFVFKKRLARGFDASFKARNLINPSRSFLQGGRVVRRFKTVRTFTAALGCAF